MVQSRQVSKVADTWTKINPVLGLNDTGIESDTAKEKTGDGTTRWNNLPYNPSTAGLVGAKRMGVPAFLGSTAFDAESTGTITVSGDGSQDGDEILVMFFLDGGAVFAVTDSAGNTYVGAQDPNGSVAVPINGAGAAFYQDSMAAFGETSRLGSGDSISISFDTPYTGTAVAYVISGVVSSALHESGVSWVSVADSVPSVHIGGTAVTLEGSIAVLINNSGETLSGGPEGYTFLRHESIPSVSGEAYVFYRTEASYEAVYTGGTWSSDCVWSVSAIAFKPNTPLIFATIPLSGDLQDLRTINPEFVAAVGTSPYPAHADHVHPIGVYQYAVLAGGFQPVHHVDLPAADSVSGGTAYWDIELGKPVFSNQSVWVDALGVPV
jgi:hypothetical protein